MNASRLLRRPRILLLVASLVAAVLAPLIVAGPASAAPPTGRNGSTSIAYAVLRMMNRERAAHHLPPLTMDHRIRVAARQHSRRMARTDTMSHQLPGEAPIGDRLTRAGYDWSWAGENVGWNSEMNRQGVLQLEQIMYDEKAPDNDHKLNILSTHFTTAGIDVLYNPAHDKVWLTVDFGRHA